MFLRNVAPAGRASLGMTNRFPGRCVTCGVRVAAGAGAYERGALYCTQHAPAPPPAVTGPQDVYGDLAADGNTIEFVQRGRMSGDLFNRYLSVKKETGVRSIERAPRQWVDLIAIPNVGRTWKAWTDAGITVTFSPRAAAAIQGAAAQQKSDDNAAQVRLSHPKAAGLFPFQRVGVQWLATRQGAILADEMGCGKTVQTLMAIGDNRPVLLVVPASLKLNWQKEAQKWRPEYRTTILSGRGSFRWPAAGEIVIVNYDILPPIPHWRGYGDLPALTGLLANPPARLTLIADEAHSVKNAKAQRTERFRFIGEVARVNGGQVWLLTGTPLLNRPPELWAVFQSGGVAREAFGSFPRFAELFNATQTGYGGAWEWGSPRPEVPELMRRVMLRREKKDVLADLPAKTVQRVPVAVEVGVRDRALFDRAQAEMEKRLAVSKETAKDVPAIPLFEEFSRALAKLAEVKTAPTIEYIEQFIEEDVPFLVFSSHIPPLHKIKAEIEKADKKCGIIIGDTPNDERQQTVEDFQSGKLDAIVISIRAGGVGLTLTRASHSVFLDLEVVPALNVQAEDRIHRIGQTLPVTIHQMVLEHPLDIRIHDILQQKMDLFAETVGASTLLPTEEAPPNEQGSALIEAAAGLQIGEPTKPPLPPPEMKKVKTVNYSQGGRVRLVVVPEQARPAQTRREEWAAEAISTLTVLDPDRALEKNESGWSAADGSTGHAMDALIASGHGLTDAQWKEAIAMLAKYHRQVGRAPPE